MNLTSQPWVLAVENGLPLELSLRDVFARAAELDDLDWADAPGAAATLSVLVAIARDAVGVSTPADVQQLLAAGEFDADTVDAYFTQYAEAFELFEGPRPFFQVADLEPLSGGPKSVSLLVPSVSTGNNVPLFSSETETSIDSLTPAEAARGVLVIQAWDTAAIKTGAKGDPKASGGKTTGNPTGALGQLGYVAVVGKNLFETIVLNCPWVLADTGDAPAWRARKPATPAWEVRPPRGPLDLLTWQSRRIRLHPEVRNGETVVSGVIVAAGDRLSVLDSRLETRTAWRRVVKPKPGDPPLRPSRHRLGWAGWRGLASLVVESSAPDGPVRPGVIAQVEELVDRGVLATAAEVSVQLVGVEYGNQSAVVEHVIADRTPLPLLALDPARGERIRALLGLMAGQAEAVGRALNTLADNLRIAGGGGKVPWDKGQRVGDRFVLALGREADRMLRGLRADPTKADQAPEVWEFVLRRDAWQVAEPLIASTGPQAFLGRVAGKVILRQQSAEAFFKRALDKALPTTALTRGGPGNGHDASIRKETA